MLSRADLSRRAGGAVSCEQGRGASRSPDDISAAIGKHLSDVEHIAIWTIGSKVGDESLKPDLAGSWTETFSEESLDANRIPSLTGLRRQQPRVVRRSELGPSERAVWERTGIRCTLLVPLGASGEAPDGLLTVDSRGRRFSRPKLRAYLTVGTQAALALENLRLVEQARQSAVIAERRRLAHEIHDTLIQGFASIVMNLEAAEGAQEGDSARRHLA